MTGLRDTLSEIVRMAPSRRVAAGSLLSKSVYAMPSRCALWEVVRSESVSDIDHVGGCKVFTNVAEYAGDIADVYPGKKVTLCHSRHLLPLFDKWMHEKGRVTKS